MQLHAASFSNDHSLVIENVYFPSRLGRCDLFSDEHTRTIHGHCNCGFVTMDDLIERLSTH